MVGRSVGLIIWNMNLIKSKTKTTSTKMRVSACLCLFICCWFFLSITIAAADRMYILYIHMYIVCMYREWRLFSASGNRLEPLLCDSAEDDRVNCLYISGNAKIMIRFLVSPIRTRGYYL